MSHLLRAIVLIVAIGLAALFAANPVGAQPNNQGGGEKKSCTGPNGEQYTHGSVYVTYIKVGGKLKTAYTYKCNDGNWEKVSLSASSSMNLVRSSLVSLN